MAVGNETITLLRTFVFPKTLRSDSIVSNAPLHYVRHAVFACVERSKLHKLVRKFNETVCNFIISVQHHVRKCTFLYQFD